jgi:methionyl-tRNA formyltransferase
MSLNKAIILCNNRFAILTIRELHFYGLVGAILLPAKNQELREEIESLPDLKMLSQPVRKNELSEILGRSFGETGSTVGLVLSFPFILSPSQLKIPERGFYNFHFGPLPRYRGPEPLFAQVRNGEKETSVCVHELTGEVDSGPVCMEERVKIGEMDTYGSLQTKLSHTAASMALQLMKALEYTQKLPSTPQDENEKGWNTRPGMDEVFIKWETMTASEIADLCRACNPWNKGAGTRIGTMVFAFLEVEIIAEETGINIPPGTIVSLNSGGLRIATSDHKLLGVNVLYCPEGFMSGQRLIAYGYREGDRFF